MPKHTVSSFALSHMDGRETCQGRYLEELNKISVEEIQLSGVVVRKMQGFQQRPPSLPPCLPPSPNPADDYCPLLPVLKAGGPVSSKRPHPTPPPFRSSPRPVGAAGPGSLRCPPSARSWRSGPAPVSGSPPCPPAPPSLCPVPPPRLRNRFPHPVRAPARAARATAAGAVLTGPAPRPGPGPWPRPALGPGPGPPDRRPRPAPPAGSGQGTRPPPPPALPPPRPPRPGWRLASSEVVVPRRVTPRGQGAHPPGALSYHLYLDGQSRLLHLRPKKLLLAPRLPVFTYTDRGALTVDQPFVPDDCYYHGFVEGTPGSLVALSTCAGGLRGMLQLGPLVYEIEPLPASAGFEHVVSRVEEEEEEEEDDEDRGEDGDGEREGAAGGTPRRRCGLSEEELALQAGGPAGPRARAGPADDWWTHSRHVEFVVVVDHLRFQHTQRNRSRVLHEVLQVVNMMDSLYRPLGAFVYLTGLEIWTDRNQLDVTTGIESLLLAFAEWKNRNLYERLPHDAAHLFVKHEYGQFLGKAFVGTICDRMLSAGIDAFFDDRLMEFAITVAHELGHNFGMLHDLPYCDCAQAKCIMDAFPATANAFSNCSYARYVDLTSQPQTRCVLGPPDERLVIAPQRCGNGLVEEDEDCDCGSAEECRRDPCCREGCRLRPEAECAYGPCCQDCRVASSGRLCRPPVDACDLPEYCNGTSHWCQEDVYMQDGTPCSETAFCFESFCRDRLARCRAVFGPEARDAPPDCYRDVNAVGDRFGNCGRGREAYRRCEEDHVLCGRLQCAEVRRIPPLEHDATVVQTAVNGTLCFGIDHHEGLERPDVGAVQNGSVCGPGRICFDRRCVNYSVLRYDCREEKCNFKGICNNKGHCHCLYGWSPPFCLEKGYGGSVDSGPSPQVFSLTDTLIALGVVLLCLLLLLLLLCVVCSKGLKRLAPLKKRARESRQALAPDWDPSPEAKPGPATRAPPPGTRAPPQETGAPLQETRAPPQETRAPPPETRSPPPETQSPPPETRAPPWDGTALRPPQGPCDAPRSRAP
ncbi:disintegrin and metalloproteinase domain-containing protein 20-like [Tachyglossus aculeatus]|uniref:disintegrin and metalloproteinase domain-containing protein 20-like n=1 Tax=Tachyglossus aculeatus TaxID=9261 RepID=UPI0018F3876F|nr:disintegrin and metalloproteinase domain-containing protein 20-like [Tachyglossus aculeatus]